MIRPARIEDIDKIVSMIHEDCEEINYPFNKEHVIWQLTEMIKLECLIFVNEKQGELVGLLAMIINKNFFNPIILEMLEFIWYASINLSNFGRARVMIELLDFMLFTVKEKNMQLHISLPETKKTESLKELLKDRGFEQTEIYYKWGM